MLNRTLVLMTLGACCLITVANAGSIRKMLINGRTKSPVFELTTPRAGASCSSKEVRLTIIPSAPPQAQTCEKGYCTPADPNSFTYRDRSRRVLSSELRLGVGDAAAGPVEPVDGPGDLKWLCREDEEGQQCICIPWFQD